MENKSVSCFEFLLQVPLLAFIRSLKNITTLIGY